VRITARGRRLLTVLVLAAGFGLAAVVGAALDGDGNELRLAGESSVVVRPGDTLWSIASTVAGGADVRPVIDEIQRLNDLGPAATLVPGQVLLLP
jgi:nucleoid-associated protein YgaU